MPSQKLTLAISGRNQEPLATQAELCGINHSAYVSLLINQDVDYTYGSNPDSYKIGKAEKMLESLELSPELNALVNAKLNLKAVSVEAAFDIAYAKIMGNLVRAIVETCVTNKPTANSKSPARVKTSIERSEESVASLLAFFEQEYGFEPEEDFQQRYVESQVFKTAYRKLAN